MDTTNLPDEREVDNVADHFIIVLAGLELLGQVTDTIVDWDDTIREFLTESIVHAATESTEGVCDFEVTDEVRTVALDVLTATDELYEEDPLQGWI